MIHMILILLRTARLLPGGGDLYHTKLYLCTYIRPAAVSQVVYILSAAAVFILHQPWMGSNRWPPARTRRADLFPLILAAVMCSSSE